MKTVRTLVCALLLHCIAGNVSASPIAWVGTTPDLNTAANWNPAAVPGTADQAVFNGGSSVNAPTFAATLGGGSGFGGMVVTGGQTSALNISNAGAAGIVGLRLVSNAGLQIDPGAGAVTIGSGPAFYWNVGTGTSNLVNNSASTATIGSNVSLNTSGGVASNWVFSGTGNWLVDGVTTAAVVNVSYTGSGTLTLNGNNAHSGVTTVGSGTLRLGSNTALGSTAAGTVVNAGATLDINARSIQGEAVTVAGTITNTGGEQQNALRNVTLSGNAVFAGTGRWDVRGPAGTLNLAGFTLTKTGTNMTAVVDSTISPGAITVNQGTLALTRSNWGSGSLTVASGATLQFENNSGANHTYTMGMAVNGGTVRTLGGATTVNSAVALTGANTFQVDNNSLTLGGSISGTGSFKKSASGTLVLAGDNSSLSGQITLGGGGLAIASSSNLGTGLLDFRADSGQTITLRSNDAGTLTLNNPLNLATNVTLGAPATGDLVFNGALPTGGGAKTITVNGVTATFHGLVSGTSAALTKAGPGTLVFTNAGNNYSKPTVIAAGALLVHGTHTGGGLYTVAPGATLGGAGTITAPVLLQGAVSPGASVGTLTTGSETWDAGASYLWEIDDVDAGPGAGWDLLNITGALTVAATAAQPFTIDVVSLALGGAPGAVHDFDPLGAYSWEIARASGGVDGFAEGKFLLDLGGFQNDWHGGRWFVSRQGGSVFVNYAIPEPSTFALAAIAMLALLAWRRWSWR